jgi:hypothetical protein
MAERVMPISELRDMSGYDRKMCGILFCLSDLAIGTLKACFIRVPKHVGLVFGVGVFA